MNVNWTQGYYLVPMANAQKASKFSLDSFSIANNQTLATFAFQKSHLNVKLHHPYL